MKEGSMLEAAFRVLEAEGKEMKFADLWAKVKEELEITDLEEPNRIGHFYTDLSMSGQFVVLGENKWDLRSRHTYDKVHIDMDAVYNEVNTHDDDTIETQEESEYNKSVRGNVGDDDDGEQGGDDGEDPKPAEDVGDLYGISGDKY
ncbi:MAG: DNA-directed RNA polymerase subunit delta [Bacilli bacterium]|nr:DNA-directed RNA polymerase subunit delta [Bacilli bacterium]